MLTKSIVISTIIATTGAATALSQTLPTVKRIHGNTIVDSVQLADSVRHLLASPDRLEITTGIRLRLDTIGTSLQPAVRDSLRFRSLFAALRKKVDSTVQGWCGPERGIHFCGSDNTPNHDGARKFWSHGDDGDFTFVKMLNVQGFGNQGQSLYAELIADLWSNWRIGLAGVFTP